MSEQINSDLFEKLRSGDRKVLARLISLVENASKGSQEILKNLQSSDIPVYGFTGPPGAGKSTLINALLRKLSSMGKKTAVVAVDPTSPFNYGSLLGDRLRMSEHFNDDKIFIRSVATRGSLGGLSEMIFEIIDVMKSADFDLILIETVGVGQSEVEIAGLADTTVVITVPESGDDIQTFKSGIMEIADIFVVNKADREGADSMVSYLQKMLHEKPEEDWRIPVLKCIATENAGIGELFSAMEKHYKSRHFNEKQLYLYTEKVFNLIRKKRMKNIDKGQIRDQVKAAIDAGKLNVYSLAEILS